MTDYQPLIARAIEGLGKSTGEARRTLYERARSALVTQLRAVDPPLSESEITKERLSLEEAIRKVEAEAARKTRVEAARNEPRFEPRPLKPSPPPPEPEWDDEHHDEAAHEPQPGAFTPPEPPRPSAPASARDRLLGARNAPPMRQDGLRGIRNVVSEVDELGGASARAAQSARDTRDTYDSIPQRPQPADDMRSSLRSRFDQSYESNNLRSTDFDTSQIRSLEPTYEDEVDEGAMFPPQPTRPQPRGPAGDEDYVAPRPMRAPRSYAGIIRGVVLLAIAALLLGGISWQWSNITRFVSGFGAKQQSQTGTQQTPQAQPKFSGRVPQEQSGQTSTQSGPAVAQRVVLYEEDPNDPQGKRYVGSAIWRTETVSPGPGLAPELAVRADIEIPERRITVTWSLRRNTDPALPASHTIEIMFNLPADFPGGGISNVPGVLMKQSEQARGTPLAGLAVKVTNGFFLIGLSAVDADQQRNIQLLKERAWFDIPLVYTNGGRAILAMEKGTPGDRAFAEAFAAWGK
jgi:hypothetical protein